jgi:hypothetical protein
MQQSDKMNEGCFSRSIGTVNSFPCSIFKVKPWSISRIIIWNLDLCFQCNFVVARFFLKFHLLI